MDKYLTPYQSSTKIKSKTASLYSKVSKQAVIALYRKYYLDFVVFGFSADSVEEIINSASGNIFDHSSQVLKK